MAKRKINLESEEKPIINYDNNDLKIDGKVLVSNGGEKPKYEFVSPGVNVKEIEIHLNNTQTLLNETLTQLDDALEEKNLIKEDLDKLIAKYKTDMTIKNQEIESLKSKLSNGVDKELAEIKDNLQGLFNEMDDALRGKFSGGVPLPDAKVGAILAKLQTRFPFLRK